MNRSESSEIPFIRPTFPAALALAEDFDDIVEANWFTNFGPKERKFAHALGDYLGPEIQVATFGNATLALIAAIHATVGQGERDRYLLMPSFTFVAVAQAAHWAGYRPWFIDVDADTWQPSVLSARAALERSRDDIAGIVHANVFGVGSPRIAAWERLAAEWDLPLVIDSAAGFGSSYCDGERLGGRGACEIFSFHATKPFAIGEGGALASRNPKLVERARNFGDFGFVGRGCTQPGLNGKMQELCAAIGLRQLAGLDQRLASRRAVLDIYRAELNDFGLRFQPNADASSVCFASAMCDSAVQKAAVLASLRLDEIRAHDYYNPPQHRQPYFLANPQLVRSTDLACTEEICSRIVSLPVHDNMASADVSRVIAAVQRGVLGMEKQHAVTASRET